MNKFGSLMCITGVLVMVMLILPGCSGFGSIEEPLAAEPVVTANGGAGEIRKISDVPTATPKRRDPVPVTVPRVTQGEVIGVVRELRANGCIIKKVATTDGIHYSQLLVTCGEPQTPPVQ